MSEAVAPAASVAVTSPTIEALTALVPDPTPAPGPAASTAMPGAERSSMPVEPSVASDAPAADEAPPAEAAPAAPPDVDNEALERAEAAAKRAREGSRRYREMLDQQRQAQEEVQRAAREAERLRQEAEQGRKLREELTKDPYAALKRLGMTEQDLAERALREGTPEAELHTIKEQLQAERDARVALERRLAAEREAAAARQAEQKFAQVADNEASYPRLAALSTGAQLAVARAALQQIANNGYEVSGFTDEQVAEACEAFLAPKKTAKAAAKVEAAPKPAPKPANKTLTNAVSTERATAPKAWHELSDEEQIAQIAASLGDPTS